MFRPAHFMIFLALLRHAWAFPSGAHDNGTNPLEVITSHCTSGNFRPNHGNFLPQASPAPYVITLSALTGDAYHPGQPITITIESKSNSQQPFKGFFLHGDSTEISFAGEITCQGQGKRVSYCGKFGATHTDGQIKDKVICQWNPPDFQIGRVQFVATIVENFSTFWTGVKSSVTLIPDPTTMSYQEKSRQIQEQMWRQFQSGPSSSARLPPQFGQQFGLS